MHDCEMLKFLAQIPGTQHRSDYAEHLFFIARMRDKPRAILEIGSFLGGSAIALAHAAPTATIYCVDPAFIPYRNGAESICHYHFRRNTENAGVDRRVIALQHYSEDYYDNLMTSFPDTLFDLVYIDGEHTFEAVSLDCRFARFVPVGGFVAFDDWIASVALAAEKHLLFYGNWQEALPDSFIPRVYKRVP